MGKDRTVLDKVQESTAERKEGRKQRFEEVSETGALELEGSVCVGVGVCVCFALESRPWSPSVPAVYQLAPAARVPALGPGLAVDPRVAPVPDLPGSPWPRPRARLVPPLV